LPHHHSLTLLRHFAGMMRPALATMLLLAFALPVFAAENAGHTGLLSNKEMTLVNHNATSTQKLLFPEQQVSACAPFDTGGKAGPFTGLAYCKVETAHMLNKGLHPLRGPDLYCSYLREEFCDVKQP
jgi:hypothetical protein